MVPRPLTLAQGGLLDSFGMPPLSADGLDWTQRHLVVSARASDFDDAYAFEHHLNRTRNVSDWLIGQQSLSWRGNFWDEHGVATLVVDLSREIALNFPLRLAARGAVASHHTCRVRVHRTGFGRKLHENELALYKKWGVVEVHLDAMDDGLEVWPKLGFEAYSPGIVVEAWEAWADALGHDPKPFPKMRDYPRDFLRSLGYVHMYKVV